MIASNLAMIAVMAVYLLSIIIGIVLTVRNKELSGMQKFLWVIIFLLFNIPALLIYLLAYRRKKRPQE